MCLLESREKLLSPLLPPPLFSFSQATKFFSREPSSRPRGQETISLFLSFAVSLFLRLSSGDTFSASSHSHMSTVVCSGNHPLRRSAGVFSGSAECARRSTELRKAGRPKRTTAVIVISGEESAMTDDTGSETHVTKERKRERENDSPDVNAICK